MALDDYILWKTHDMLDASNCDADIPQSSDSILWLCAENEDAGRTSGPKIGQIAENEGRPIARYESTHNNIAARNLKPDAPMGNRSISHIATGAPGMLTCNRTYGVETVLLGLMSGARGVVLGRRRSECSAPPRHRRK